MAMSRQSNVQSLAAASSAPPSSRQASWRWLVGAVLFVGAVLSLEAAFLGFWLQGSIEDGVVRQSWPVGVGGIALCALLAFVAIRLVRLSGAQVVVAVAAAGVIAVGNFVLVWALAS